MKIILVFSFCVAAAYAGVQDWSPQAEREYSDLYARYCSGGGDSGVEGSLAWHCKKTKEPATRRNKEYVHQLNLPSSSKQQIVFLETPGDTYNHEIVVTGQGTASHSTKIVVVPSKDTHNYDVKSQVKVDSTAGKPSIFFLRNSAGEPQQRSDAPMTFSFGNLLNSDLDLFPGESINLRDDSDVSIEDALYQVQDTITDYKKIDFAYKMYQNKFNNNGDPINSDRFNAFKKTIYEIMRNNLYSRLKRNSFQSTINEFTDVPYEELLKKYTGSLDTPKTPGRQPTRTNTTQRPSGRYPESKSWLDEGYVSEVKNQKQCGSCVMFAVSAAIESAVAIATDPNPSNRNRKFPDLSEQQILDCGATLATGEPFTCNGNHNSEVLEYVQKSGQTGESRYPYREKRENCRSKDSSVLQENSIEFMELENDEEKMKQALADNGPLVVSFRVPAVFQSYNKGVLSRPCTEDDKGGHAVLIVGYGTENGLDYWLIKNSWGTEWGDNGFFKIARNVNYCDIKDKGSFIVRYKK